MRERAPTNSDESHAASVESSTQVRAPYHDYPYAQTIDIVITNWMHTDTSLTKEHESHR